MTSGPNWPGPWPGVLIKFYWNTHLWISISAFVLQQQSWAVGQRLHGPQMLEYSLPLYRKGLPAPGMDD